MANRTPRHQKPGDKNLKGKLSKSFCPCCDDVINHKQKIINEIHNKEIKEYPMTGLFSRLTEQQKHEVLSYDGAINIGQKTMTLGPDGKGMDCNSIAPVGSEFDSHRRLN